MNKDRDRKIDGAGFWNCTGEICDTNHSTFHQAIQKYYNQFITEQSEKIKQDNIENKNNYKSIYTRIPLIKKSKAKLKQIITLLTKTNMILSQNNSRDKYNAFMEDPSRFINQAFYFEDVRNTFDKTILSFLEEYNPTKEDIAYILLNELLYGNNTYSKYNNFINSDFENTLKKAYEKYVNLYLEHEETLKRSNQIMKIQAENRARAAFSTERTTAPASTSARTTSRPAKRRVR